MHPPGADTVLVRFSGEIGVKSASLQQRMEGMVRENLAAMLAERGLDASIDDEFTRLYLHTDEAQIEAVTDVAAKVFGVTSVSPVLRVDPTMADICAGLEATAREHYDGGRFAVRARRAGDADAHPFSSTDIERDGGSAVFETAQDAGFEPVVDLEDPDTTFGVECRPDEAFVYLEQRSGPGGLPLGTQEPVVALVSGGIDSPVAAWLVMKRGCPLIPVYVDLGTFGGVDHRGRAERTVQHLAEYMPGTVPLRVVPGGEALEEIVDTTSQYRMVIVRRFMLRVASRVAANTGAEGIVTGESIGQKSSQTTASLRVTGAVTDYPVHRPLLTYDKSEISDRAREIGTYGDATIDAGCHRLAPDNPATAPPLDRVRDVEPPDIDGAAHRAVANVDTVEVEDIASEEPR